VDRPSATPGICRIDQPHKHNHGWFVRLQRRMAADLGEPLQMSRREWAEIRRRRGRSGIHGVQRVIDRTVRLWRKAWKAIWSPVPGKVRKRQFSIRKYGEEAAKLLAIRARQEGLRKMK
jgi:hypothetical protein